MSKTIVTVLEELCSENRCLTSSAILRRVGLGDIIGIQRMSISPTDYVTPTGYYRDAALVGFLKKVPLPVGIPERERAATTLTRFLDTEKRCLKTNMFLRKFRFNYGLTPSDLDAADFLVRWRKIFREALGPIPRRVEFLFSSGATYSDRGELTTPADKLSAIPSMYEHSASVLLPFFWETAWGRELCKRGRVPQVVPGNRYFQVPKRSDTNRSAAAEATLNVCAQLWLGRHLRKPLRSRYDIRIESIGGAPSAKDIHMSLARESSVTGRLATLDLSDASDLNARELVRYLAGADWYGVFDALSARYCDIGGKRLLLEKMSSMGNGFTFELETLLFATLCEAAGCKFIQVFGDDILIERERAETVVKWLVTFGHKINEAKSFIDGPFRESCGGDYFEGMDVRPVFPDKDPCEPHEWIALHNQLVRAEKLGFTTRRARRLCVESIPKRLRNFGPERLGDVVLHGPPSSWRPVTHKVAGHDMYYGWVPVNAHIPWKHFPDWGRLLYRLAVDPSRRAISARDSVVGYRLKLVDLTSRWLP